MKEAIIIYNSKTGITKELGKNICVFLEKNEIATKIVSINEADNLPVSSYDYIFLGCWTSGLLLFFQKPEKLWVEFAKQLPELDSTKTILFTTYKVRTGSMFRNMKKYLHLSGNKNNVIEIASLNGGLPERYQNELFNLIKNY